MWKSLLLRSQHSNKGNTHCSSLKAQHNTLPLMKHIMILCNRRSTAFASSSLSNSLMLKRWGCPQKVHQSLLSLCPSSQHTYLTGWSTVQAWELGIILPLILATAPLSLLWQGLHLWLWKSVVSAQVLLSLTFILWPARCPPLFYWS